MANQEVCLDRYHESLKVGDYVIPAYKETIDLGISGFISNIMYYEPRDTHYITIVDENGNILLKDVCSLYYTTKERKEIRDNKQYVYLLTFYNSKLQRFFQLPLTNTTDINFSIPNGTCYVTLDAFHLEEKGRQNKRETIFTCYSQFAIYFFLLKEKLEIVQDEKGNTFIYNSDARFPFIIKGDYRVLENQEELQQFIKRLITYFNNTNIANINNEKEFKKNKEKQEFEEQLILKLKNSLA